MYVVPICIYIQSNMRMVRVVEANGLLIILMYNLHRKQCLLTLVLVLDVVMVGFEYTNSQHSSTCTLDNGQSPQITLTVMNIYMHAPTKPHTHIHINQILVRY